MNNLVQWGKDGETDLSESAVKRQIEKYTSYKRRVQRNKSLRTPEKQAIKLKKKGRRQELKEKGFTKQFVSKNRKRVKLNKIDPPNKAEKAWKENRNGEDSDGHSQAQDRNDDKDDQGRKETASESDEFSNIDKSKNSGDYESSGQELNQESSEEENKADKYNGAESVDLFHTEFEELKKGRTS